MAVSPVLRLEERLFRTRQSRRARRNYDLQSCTLWRAVRASYGPKPFSNRISFVAIETIGV
jgi:hypothetical protein